jgi:hypothetical protein
MPDVVVLSPSGRESIQTKARRLLAEGRVEVTCRVEGLPIARVRGTEESYEVRWDRGRGWRCDCVAGAFRPCSHRLAVALVVVPDRETA